MHFTAAASPRGPDGCPRRMSNVDVSNVECRPDGRATDNLEMSYVTMFRGGPSPWLQGDRSVEGGTSKCRPESRAAHRPSPRGPEARTQCQLWTCQMWYVAPGCRATVETFESSPFFLMFACGRSPWIQGDLRFKNLPASTCQMWKALLAHRATACFSWKHSKCYHSNGRPGFGRGGRTRWKHMFISILDRLWEPPLVVERGPHC